MNLKQKVYVQCRALVSGKLAGLQAALKDLINSAGDETKSSAGDKYETGRAMLHIEQDNVRQQISELMKHVSVLDAIDPGNSVDHIAPGSIVKTGNGYFYFSVAIGKMRVDEVDVFALSMQSPLGMKLKGLKAGDRVEMNGRDVLVEDVS